MRRGIGGENSFARAATFIKTAFPEWALRMVSARFMVKGGLELALLNARSGRLVLSMSYPHGGARHQP